MRSDQADEVLQVLLDGWPRTPEDGFARTMRRRIEHLEDQGAALAAAGRLIDATDHFPSVRQFLAAYDAEVGADPGRNMSPDQGELPSRWTPEDERRAREAMERIFSDWRSRHGREPDPVFLRDVD